MFKLCGKYKTSLQTMYDFIYDWKTVLKMNSTVDFGHIIQKIDENNIDWYIRLKSVFPLNARDVVVRLRYDKKPEEFTIYGSSAIKETMPIMPNIVRMKLH